MSINWRALSTAHGDASEVPVAIRRLTSSAEGEQDAGYRQLDNNVVLQGDLYEAAPFAALEIIQTMKGRAAWPNKYLTYRILWEIRNGAAGKRETPVALPDGRVLTLSTASKTIVDEAFALYLPDCIAQNRSLRQSALELVISLEQPRKEVEAWLQAELKRQAEPLVLEDLSCALKELQDEV